MNKLNPIGIFDSGIGGLTVAHAINKVLPNEEIIYFGDTKHLPYGNKTESKIRSYSNQITNFLIRQKCKAIIIGCNSLNNAAALQIKFKMADFQLNVVHRSSSIPQAKLKQVDENSYLYSP